MDKGSSNGLPLPPANMPQSVLDRVKAFLPLMEQANKELEQTISVEGAETVQIDAHLHEDKAEEEAEEEGEGEEEEKEEKEEKEENEKQGEVKRTVQLQFALGDFDGSALAVAEDLQRKEEAEEEAGTEAEADS